MRQVYQHSKAVHLGHRPFAEGGQTVVSGYVSRDVGQGERHVVRQIHVSCTLPIKAAQHRQAVFNGYAPLDADEAGDLARSRNPLHVVGAQGQFQVVRIASDHAMDQVNLIGHGSRWIGLVAGNAGRPELCLQPPWRERGRSVWVESKLLMIYSHENITSPSSRSFQGRSL